uniref:BTB domain-containing protein n=1 Tax=Panagrolaimus davidi TaxID=227884 RepID=A0A914PWG7_9BILA
MQPATIKGRKFTNCGPSYEQRRERIHHENAYQLQCKRLEVFKLQDLEKGRFDVTFEIEEKKLHAHSFVLTSVSEYMDAKLTDRWSKKNEVVKIESYTYDNFYQFLCFLYIGKCEVTNENVFKLVDMAEFYGVSLLKKYCDSFLSKTEDGIITFTVENIEEIFEFCQKYSLEKLEYSLRSFIDDNFDEINKTEKFNAFKKLFIQFLFGVERAFICSFEKDSTKVYNRVKEDEFFGAVYKWAENQVTKYESSNDNNFNLDDAIKVELNDFLPHTEFWKMTYDFLRDFVVEKGFFLSPDELKKFFLSYRADGENEENVVKAAYELAKKQALKKQKLILDGQSFNVADSIKADLAGIIPQIKFCEMKKLFLMDFVVANGILSEEQADFQIENNGNTISGVFKDSFGIREKLQMRTYSRYDTKQNSSNSNRKIRYTGLKFPIPSTSATVEKMKGGQWYLCLEEDGILTFKYHTLVQRSDYLIAEMKSDKEFVLNPNHRTRLTARFNNI